MDVNLNALIPVSSPQTPAILSSNQTVALARPIEFDYSEDIEPGKLIITIYGDKGAGKTTIAAAIATGMLGGFHRKTRTHIISFDNKSKITCDQFFHPYGIRVFNGKKYFRDGSAYCIDTAALTYEYLQGLISGWLDDQPDWIIVDGYSIMAYIMELVMRHRNGLKPTEGFANLNLWKDRARFVQDIHQLCVRAAKFGVIYTTYTDFDELLEAGKVVTRKEVPRYFDIIMQETDVLLKVFKTTSDRFLVKVDSTKYKTYIGIDNLPIPRSPTTLTQNKVYDITESFYTLTPPLENYAPQSQITPPSNRTVSPQTIQQMVTQLAAPQQPKQEIPAAPAVSQPNVVIPAQATPSPAQTHPVSDPVTTPQKTPGGIDFSGLKI